MTTSVRITNEGPGYVRVATPTGADVQLILAPGASTKQTVYQGRAFTVTELGEQVVFPASPLAPIGGADTAKEKTS